MVSDESADVKSQDSKPTKDNKVEEIKAYLDTHGIKYDSTAKKDELLALVGE